MADLAALVRASMTRWGETALERKVFDTDEPAEVAAALGRFCEEALGVPVSDGLFYEASVGCVIGVGLADGSSAVVKAYQPRWTAAFLNDVCRVQAHLARQGFPCATPMTGPRPLRDGHAVVEQLLPDPGPAAVEPTMLDLSAAGLARQIELCRGMGAPGLRRHPLGVVPGALYPEPHSPVFDFEATSAGAEWIDELAVEAGRRGAGPELPPVVAHTDWSAGNVRMRGDELVAVYDWDSLSLVPECKALAGAALTWRARATPGEDAPTVPEIVDYVHAYEDARGSPLDAGARDAIGPAVVSALAYTARCEHAIDPRGLRHRRARPRLAEDAAPLFALGASL